MSTLKHTGTALIVLLTGCADFNVPLNGSPVDARELRLQGMESKVADLNRRVENLNLAALAQDNRRLEGEIRTLRGEVERLIYLTDKSGGQNK